MNRTPLYEKHISLGAKIVDFAGWEMPVYYTGIIEEHLHTRNKAGLFDICHMGEFFFKGKDAAREVDKLVTCRTDDMPVGKCRYGFFLSKEGQIIDDLIVFKMAEDEFMIVVNAGTIPKDLAWVESNMSGDVVFSDRSERTAKIDIQGPLSQQIIKDVFGEKEGDVGRYSFVMADFEGSDVILSRTGYTGEIGYELFFSVDQASSVWDRLMAFDGVKPIGLGARDTLRLEMGYPLYGSDIHDGVTPIEAGLGRFVYLEKDFIGKEALVEKLKQGYTKILSGFVCEGRRIARHGFKVFVEDSESGIVTSGAFSPCLKKAIGLCYIDKNKINEGGDITLTDGKISIPAKLEKVPVFKK